MEKFFGGANHKQTAEEKELGVSNEELTFRNLLGDHRREPIVVTDVPKDFIDEMKSAAPTTPTTPTTPTNSTKSENA